MLELIYKLIEKVPSIVFINDNTDGLMFSIKREEADIVGEIIHSWEKQHCMTMEEDIIKQTIQRDVNNYVIEFEDGTLKYKGGTLGDYNKKDKWKHNSLAICAEAIVKKLVYDIPIEDTILNCNDLEKFQMIAKRGHTYKSTMRLVDNEYVEVQRVNRIFAGKDERLGALYKVKEENGRLRYDKIANCPLKTLVDGYDNFTIDDIDKMWYIEYALRKHKEFIFNKEELKNANKKTRSRTKDKQ